MANSASLKPRVSEKTYALAERSNTYVFEVPNTVNKHDISRSVANQFGVTVTNVRIAGVPGKVKRSFRRGGRNVFRGKRSNVRKAYVTLNEGDKLPIFNSVEEPAMQTEEKKGKK